MPQGAVCFQAAPYLFVLIFFIFLQPIKNTIGVLAALLSCRYEKHIASEININ